MDETQLVNLRATASGHADISIWAMPEASKVRSNLNVQEVREMICSGVTVMVESPSWEHCSMSWTASML
jgi:hypothetical protein